MTAVLIIIAIELAIGIVIMTRVAWQASNQRHEIYYQLTAIWQAIKEQ